jgi:acetate kinase
VTAPGSVLALNLGSASVKAACYAVRSGRGSGIELVARATLEGGRRDEVKDDAPALLERLLETLPLGAGLATVIHRVVHGADRRGPEILTPETLSDLDVLSDWAPLHQPPALELARAALARWPRAVHLAAFDTSWHRTMPERHQVLPLPFELYRRGVKRYGFHGLAFQSVMRQLALASPDLANRRVVLAHLGGGSSLCAVNDGRSVDTTMGLTPLDGIPMGTRTGSLDPGVILHLQRDLALPAADIDRMLWRDSGLRGLSETSGDMRQLLAADSAGSHRAIDAYVDGVAKGIAAMATSLRGIDALVFSGGIGRQAPAVRARIAEALDWLGLALNEQANADNALLISLASSSAKCYVVEVDEEREMALIAVELQR